MPIAPVPDGLGALRRAPGRACGGQPGGVQWSGIRLARGSACRGGVWGQSALQLRCSARAPGGAGWPRWWRLGRPNRSVPDVSMAIFAHPWPVRWRFDGESCVALRMRYCAWWRRIRRLGWLFLVRPQLTMTLRWPLRVALTLLCLPFFLAGILVAGWVAMWATGASPEHGNWSFPFVFFPLMLICVLVGALLVYAIVMFTFGWLAPNSELLLESEAAASFSQRLLWPAFRAVRVIALALTPYRHRKPSERAE